jgi:heme/copper-type cytochrome/quinol oxidase subunit 1
MMVERTPRAFVKAGLFWLSGGVTLGLALAIRPEWIVYRPAHVHMNLLGFVAMIIFGVGYQILPRMMGYGLHSPRLAIVHWWLANLGLGLMVAGFFLRPSGLAAGQPVLVLGGVLETVGAYCFVFNLLRSMKRPAELRGPAGGSKPLPVVAIAD